MLELSSAISPSWSASGLGPSALSGLMPVTEQPMMSPCLRQPRYHFGPMRCILTQMNPAASNHLMYSSSVGKSIQASAMARENQCVGCTGPTMQAKEPGLTTRKASAMARWGSGQYSMEPQLTYRSKALVGKFNFSASPTWMSHPLSPAFFFALASWWGDWSTRVMLSGSTPAATTPRVENPVPPPTSMTRFTCFSPNRAGSKASFRMSSVQ
mmetsp:Transcript_13895/g.31812  ORF Transcript_13895/g.31812 Transcript_13895/m.31812 type:complete len:212 (-) Transcript_13895:382-1017(-)